jgi:transposase
MALLRDSLVDIPEDRGIHIKSAGAKGEKYVYKHVKYFRDAKGKPRNQSKAIGKFDVASGKMFPNNNYYDLYNLSPVMSEVDVWDYGYSYLVTKVCRDMGLMESLTSAFGEQRAMDIVVMASYIIREGNAMDGIDDWLSRNFFPKYKKKLNSQSTSSIFSALSAGQMHKFFSKWVKTALGDGAVCYDVTSISSYARQMPAVERGYNRDGENLSQFNLGMFCDETNKTPIYYNRYNGSLTDKTNLSYVLANAESVGIRHVKMVLDGGFMDKGCLKSLHEICSSFVVGLPTYLKESQSILTEYGDKVDDYANALDWPHMFCIPVDRKIQEVSGKAFLYFDALNHVLLCDELSAKINRLKAELSSLKQYPKNHLDRYEPYFTLTKHSQDSGFDYEVNTDKVESLRKTKGFFLIFSTDMTANPEDILFHYRAKDAVEKLFDQIKCDMDGNRIRTHNEQTTDGKVFVTFIACIIRSYLLGKLSQYLTDHSTSLKKVFSQLSNITIVSGSKGLRFTKALSKKHKQILAPFDADSHILTSLNASCMR